jgi:hypothetical protein|tara:strand:- start:263 stop:559 length:297 start_codon:yes stop_codon:yes gene_type:complete
MVSYSNYIEYPPAEIKDRAKPLKIIWQTAGPSVNFKTNQSLMRLFVPAFDQRRVRRLGLICSHGTFVLFQVLIKNIKFACQQKQKKTNFIQKNHHLNG